MRTETPGNVTKLNGHLPWNKMDPFWIIWAISPWSLPNWNFYLNTASNKITAEQKRWISVLTGLRNLSCRSVVNDSWCNKLFIYLFIYFCLPFPFASIKFDGERRLWNWNWRLKTGHKSVLFYQLDSKNYWRDWLSLHSAYELDQVYEC